MKFKELKAKNAKELEGLLTGARGDLQTLKFKVASRQIKDVREIRATKKLVAQILTLKEQRKDQFKVSSK